MALRTETLNFLRELERSSGRTLNYRDEIGLLVEVADRTGNMGAFNEAIFLAKFITKSMGVMKRIGIDGQGYDKLSTEFQSNIHKVSALLNGILEGAHEEARKNMSSLFFSMSQVALEHLVLFLSDLTMVKNWVLDGKQLPGESADR